jgi:hypothetical protein
MRLAADRLRSNALLISLSEERPSVTPHLIAKALERDLRIPWNQMVGNNRCYSINYSYTWRPHTQLCLTSITLPFFSNASSVNQQLIRFLFLLNI